MVVWMAPKCIRNEMKVNEFEIIQSRAEQTPILQTDNRRLNTQQHFHKSYKTNENV